MISAERKVSTVTDLVAATKDASVSSIVVHGRLAEAPSVRLAPGQVLQGEDENATIVFAASVDGLQLSRDNQVRNLRLQTSPDKRAIYNDTSVDGLGRIRLAGIVATGQVQILARDRVRSGHVEIDGLDIVAADARGQGDRPNGYGVDVLQGAFTLWNMQADESVIVTATLKGLSAGRASAPVLGSGIFVSGAGFRGGRVVVSVLETGEVHSHGTIPMGTPDQITGGVFAVFNAHVAQVHNLGSVTTYGPNDMVLDNWGAVDRWVAEEKLTSFGPSGIGFVNFGIVNELKVNSAIETFGQGARGYNVYTGTVNDAEFDRIITHADGAVRIQISQPVGRLAVRRGIETFGGSGDSLVKGVVVKLSAIALSVKPGGSAREIDVNGGIVTHGLDISPIEMLGTIGALRIFGGVKASGGTPHDNG